MATLHKDLTGADLHEPKGADGAAVDTAYVSDGAGSGSWQKIGADSIDTSTVLNVNKVVLALPFKTVTTAGSLVLPAWTNLTLTKATAILSAAISSTNLILTFNKNGTTSAGTITIPTAGSAKGVAVSLSPSGNNTFTSSDWLDIVSAGSTGPADVTIVLEFTLT